MLKENIGMLEASKYDTHGVWRIPADRLFYPLSQDYSAPSPEWPAGDADQDEENDRLSPEVKETLIRSSPRLNKELPPLPPASPGSQLDHIFREAPALRLTHLHSMPTPGPSTGRRRRGSTIRTLPEEVQLRPPVEKQMNSPAGKRKFQAREAKVKGESMKELAEFFKHAGPGEGQRITVAREYIAELLRVARSKASRSPSTHSNAETAPDETTNPGSRHDGINSLSMTSTEIFKLGPDM